MKNRIRELKEEVKKGKIASALKLAEAFKWGYYGEADPQRAARMYRICCKAKDKKLAALAYYNLGILYYYGYLNGDGNCESEKAFSCFLQSTIKSPTRAAICKIGDMYRYGQYVKKDESRALSFYLMANQIA